MALMFTISNDVRFIFFWGAVYPTQVSAQRLTGFHCPAIFAPVCCEDVSRKKMPTSNNYECAVAEGIECGSPEFESTDCDCSLADDEPVCCTSKKPSDPNS